MAVGARDKGQGRLQWHATWLQIYKWSILSVYLSYWVMSIYLRRQRML